MNVTEAVTSRTSIRSFLDTPVTADDLRSILETARWAPSGGNTQPWHVYGLSGQSMHAFKALLAEDLAANPVGDAMEFPMYPAEIKEPYRSRRFKCGEDMYATIGIPREDKPARFAHIAKNYDFFGAPAAFFFAIDRQMGQGQWAHLGMLMQTIALVAQERGIATCMQEFWMMRHKLVRSFYAIPDELMVYCGMAVGYADPSAAINSLRTDRAPVDAFATFAG